VSDRIPLRDFVSSLKPSVQRREVVRLLVRLNDHMPIYIEHPNTLKIKLLRDIVDSEVCIL
jgi:hypothetical protein